MRAGMQRVVQREQSPTSQKRAEMRLVGWHCELHVGAGFVEEVPENGAGDDVCGCGPAAQDGGFYVRHATGFGEGGDEGVSHAAERVETLFGGADEEDGDFIFLVGV